MTSFKQRHEAYINQIEAALDKYLESRPPHGLYEAMRYSVFAGGKRIRPVLMLSVCEALGGKAEDAMAFACALEMLHTASLIHDDMPEIDNDELRRGLPTCHKKFGQSRALLAGDALMNLAYEIITSRIAEEPKYAKIGALMSKWGGSEGMLAGQYTDVVSEGKKIDEETLLYIHNNKTGGFIKAAMAVGAMVATNSEDIIKRAESLGEAIGLAFQIKDDILDITQTSDVLGKPAGSDEKNEKATYVSFYGLEGAKEKYGELCEKIRRDISSFDGDNKFISEYVEMLINRNK